MIAYWTDVAFWVIFMACAGACLRPLLQRIGRRR